MLRFWKKRMEMPGRWRTVETLEDRNRDEEQEEISVLVSTTTPQCGVRLMHFLAQRQHPEA